MKLAEKNWLEWLIFVLSSIIVFSMATYLIFLAFTLGNEPPEMTAELGKPVRQRTGYAIPLTLKNSGDTTAQDVQVTVRIEGSQPEEIQVEVDYVPRRSRRLAWARLKSDPQGRRMTAHVTGYAEP